MIFEHTKLWFDVGIKRYTTLIAKRIIRGVLWFDVGIKRYTTAVSNLMSELVLWFDVGIKRYTTDGSIFFNVSGCGLM